ncbi:hypothetical protein SDC9_74843 [bioreactor metagenome]|uniref:Uncharacterized protein n=1 Tax=bioreactor metagenome TaxID=1076179 RepID=A0A644YI71_9ZZZZ
MKDFVFVVDTPPDEYTMDQFYKGLAEILIKKYGVEAIREALRQIKEREGQV